MKITLQLNNQGVLIVHQKTNHMVDLTRSRAIFEPLNYTDKIYVIGAGAIGSHLVDDLVSHGVRGSQIYVYDPDIIESKNVGNQLYDNPHIGKPKVVALQEMMKERYDETIKIYQEKVVSCKRRHMKGVVFLAVDEGRADLYKTLRFNPNIQQVFEAGMVTKAGIAVNFNPLDLDHLRWFEENRLANTGSDDSELSACGQRQVVKIMSSTMGNILASKFFRWVHNKTLTGIETFISIYPVRAHEDRFYEDE